MTHTPEPTPESTPEPVGPDPEPTDLERAEERDYLAGGHGASIDSFAYDSRGNDTGLRESDFI